MNNDYSPLLTDMYQISMGYSYFKQERHQEKAVFDVFYRKSPFDGIYTLFFGIHEVKEYINTVEFKNYEIEYLMKCLNVTDKKFKKYLESEVKKDFKKIKIVHLPEGSIASPKIPVMRIEGPLFVCQLIETAVLALTGFSSLVATNASRICSASRNRSVLEFGLRRAQGINGALTASKYAVLGGCSGTSNVLSGLRNGSNVLGTMAHSFICSFQGYTTIPTKYENHPFVDLVLRIKEESLKVTNNKWQNYLNLENHEINFKLKKFESLSNSELISFIIYAVEYPTNFLALVDTYDTVLSGTINFLYVSLALYIQGNTPKGIRLDSGDLAKLARDCRNLFDLYFTEIAPEVYDSIIKDKVLSNRYNKKDYIKKVKEDYDFTNSIKIVASNDLHEQAVKELFTKDKELQIDLFGIGTHLATCKSQPALGMVYKLTSINSIPCVKFSNDEIKQTYPGKKRAFRMYLNNKPIGDILSTTDEDLSKSKRKSNKIDLYVNSNFANIVTIEYDEIVDMYIDIFDIYNIKIINKKPKQAIIEIDKLLGSNKIKKKIHKRTINEFSKLLLTHSYTTETELNSFQILKLKTEARKTIFGREILSTTKKEDPTLSYNVYLTLALRDQVKNSRGNL